MAFNEGTVKSLFPATLRHIAAVPRQRSENDGPNSEVAGTLKVRRFEMIRWREGERDHVLPYRNTKACSDLDFRQIVSDTLRSANRRARGFIRSAAHIIDVYGAGDREAMNDHVP
jgi:hypothetical protein